MCGHFKKIRSSNLKNMPKLRFKNSQELDSSCETVGHVLGVFMAIN
jgi:hypothetical protein